MKYSLLILFSLVINSVNAQINIGPNIGLNQSYMYPKSNNNQFIVDSTFKLSPVFGIKSELFFWNKKAKITIQSTYYHKTARAYESGFIPLETIDYHSINSAFLFNKSIISNFYIGIGANYIHTPFVRLNYSGDGFVLYEKRYDLGIIGSVNYSLKNFVVDFNYGYSLKTNEFHEHGIEQAFESTTFMQLQLAYLFPLKLSKSKE